MNEATVLFPAWQPSVAEYAAICRYLGLTPQPALYPRLLSHLAEAALSQAPLTPWQRHLAERRRSAFWIARMDWVTRLFLPTHPLRHWLNAVIALHECTALGHAELNRVPRGGALFRQMPLWALRLLWDSLLTGAWLVGQGLGYGLSLGWRRREHGLAGKQVLITGAGRGLGWDLTLAALERGARVVGVVRDRSRLPAGLGQLPAHAALQWLEADLAEPGALTRALDAAGVDAATLDLAILSAGIKREHASVLSEPDLRLTLQVNLHANVEFAAWYHARGGRGRLVLISSMGRWHGMPDTGGYNASKAALSIWGESLDMELIGQARPGVLIVEPGLFASGMVGQGGLQGRLSLPRRRVAERILEAALQGRRSLRPPLWFACLTWGLCLVGRGLRGRVLTRARRT